MDKNEYNLEKNPLIQEEGYNNVGDCSFLRKILDIDKFPLERLKTDSEVKYMEVSLCEIICYITQYKNVQDIKEDILRNLEDKKEKQHMDMHQFIDIF